MWSEIDLQQFSEIQTTSNHTFDNLSFADALHPHSLTFSQNEDFLARAISNPNVSAVLTTPELADKVGNSKKILTCRDPQFVFFQFHNLLSGQLVKEFPSQIHASAVIEKTAVIDPYNVIIEPNVVVENFCVIKRNTKIGTRTRIQSGSIIGATGIYVAKDSFGNKLLADHFGHVEIGYDVHVGSNTIIDKGIFPKDKTLIASNNLIGHSCAISHGVEIQESNAIANGALICGYTRIGSGNWIGPGAIITHRIEVGSRNFISLGSTLLKGIKDDTKVIGNRVFTDRTMF